MKNNLYSFLAATCAITGIANNKINNNSHRFLTIYKYVGFYPISSAHQVTFTYNWTLATVPPPCFGTIQACVVSTTIPTYTIAGRIMPSTPIPALQTITGSAPRFTATTSFFRGVYSVKSKPNSN